MNRLCIAIRTLWLIVSAVYWVPAAIYCAMRDEIDAEREYDDCERLGR